MIPHCIVSGASQTKSFIDPEKASIVFSHWPTASLDGADTNHEVKAMMMDPRLDLSDQVSLDVGQLHHYRGSCDPEVYKDCEEQFLRHTVRDTSVRGEPNGKIQLFNDPQVNSIVIPIYKNREKRIFGFGNRLNPPH